MRASRTSGAATDDCEQKGEEGVGILYVEYVERGKGYGSLFRCRLFCEYIHLEYVRIHVVYRVNQAEYAVHIRVAASQEYVNTYSACRVGMHTNAP